MSNPNRRALQLFVTRLLSRSVLTREEQDAILSVRSHVMQVQPHRDVVSPGQSVDHACLVLSGLAARYDQLSSGARQTTALHIPGDMCDLHSVAAPVAGWGIEALTATTMIQVPHGELLAIATRYPAIAFAFWRDTTADANILAKWVSSIGRRNSKARLAHLLCEMGLRFEYAGLGTRTDFPFKITQNQLGEALGITPVHVNRSLQVLRSENLVQTHHDRYVVDDWEQLASVAEFDPLFLLIPTEDQKLRSDRKRDPYHSPGISPGAQRAALH